jgi:hypothetical protein
MLRAAILGMAAASLSAPLAAQAPTSPSQSEDAQYLPEDDLDCAIFVGALMAEIGEAMTPDNRVGLTSSFTYFVGRFEAERDLPLITAFTRRYPIYAELDPVAIEQTCAIRMRSFGTRLQEVGSALAVLDAGQPADDTSGPPAGQPASSE